MSVPHPDTGHTAQQGKLATLGKCRHELSAAEVVSLHERLDRLLDRVGLETQPKVALRLLDLVRDPDAELRSFVDVIKTDWTLAGRLLRMANAAFYAQRSPVTTLDRALVVLGLERTKAISLGFYLSRSATPPGDQALSRAVWGESVFRAELCSALAGRLYPRFAGEAFIVGLMLDCGQPLMARFIGESYHRLRAEHASPGTLFAAEFGTLEFTHVDVATVLLRRWNLPFVLARPIGWHHALPQTGKTTDTSAQLHRLAYYAGSVQLSPSGVPVQSNPLESIANRLFEIGSEDLSKAVSRAVGQYRATIGLFEGIATPLAATDEFLDLVHHQLIETLDDQLARALYAETRGGAQHLIVCGQDIELEPASDGNVLAVINGSDGVPIISCTIDPRHDGPEVVCARLGLEDSDSHDVHTLLEAARAMAA